MAGLIYSTGIIGIIIRARSSGPSFESNCSCEVILHCGSFLIGWTLTYDLTACSAIGVVESCWELKTLIHEDMGMIPSCCLEVDTIDIVRCAHIEIDDALNRIVIIIHNRIPGSIHTLDMYLHIVILLP